MSVLYLKCIDLIPADSDMIILFGGANDWGQNAIEMGEISGELTDKTFKSAYFLMIKKSLISSLSLVSSR